MDPSFAYWGSNLTTSQVNSRTEQPIAPTNKILTVSQAADPNIMDHDQSKDDSLKYPLNTSPVLATTQQGILYYLWGLKGSMNILNGDELDQLSISSSNNLPLGVNGTDLEYCETFLRYYQVNCRQFCALYPKAGARIEHLGLINAIEMLSENYEKSKVHVKDLLLVVDNHRNSQAPILELALRLWLMINFRSDASDIAFTSRFSWTNEEQTIGEVVRNLVMSDTLPSRQFVDFSINSFFSARNLKKKTRFSLNLTTNLADHLKLDPETGRVEIFCCSSFLVNTLNSIESLGKKSPYSPEFLRETLATLNILFPRTNSKSRKHAQDLMARNRKRGLVFDDSICSHWPVMLSFDRSLAGYKFWGKRLLTLHNAFLEQSENPRSTIQLFIDNMNKQQYFTFITALVIFVLTVIFGIISSVTGIMQVKIALEASATQSRMKRSLIMHGN